MDFESKTAFWIASIERSDLGYTYVRLFVGAPRAVRHQLINRFGKGTVFLAPVQGKPLAA
ncbi:MAG: hypothetical protein LJE69_03955 [Thiohalocapsa sp.]|uniref:hypothetical protein n=1 Tax=Thiohalocapsa sp. TaxID=2497641 RepID=UPI0025E9FE2C|nr:hypothetical protein [Thiohalocapsa sp.]MCG6940388.1 hypothetical protein [Thiohalocapsa sp.]